MAAIEWWVSSWGRVSMAARVAAQPGLTHIHVTFCRASTRPRRHPACQAVQQHRWSLQTPITLPPSSQFTSTTVRTSRAATTKTKSLHSRSPHAPTNLPPPKASHNEFLVSLRFSLVYLLLSLVSPPPPFLGPHTHTCFCSSSAFTCASLYCSSPSSTSFFSFWLSLATLCGGGGGGGGWGSEGGVAWCGVGWLAWV